MFADELGVSDSASKRYLNAILQTVTPTPPLGLSLNKIMRNTLGDSKAQKFVKYMETLYLGQISDVSSSWLDQYAMPWRYINEPRPTLKNKRQI